MQKRDQTIAGLQVDGQLLYRGMMSSRASAVNVLVVEDCRQVGVALSHLLRVEGYGVHVASTCDLARRIVEQEEIDFVICELDLPDGHGGELMAELHATHGLSGVAIVEPGRVENSPELWDAGFVAALRKPIESNELLAAIRRQGCA